MHAADIIFRGGLAATLVAAMSACAAGPVGPGTPPAGAESGVAAGMARIGDLPGDSQYQRFIVKYRPASEPGRSSAAVQQRLDAVASSAGFAGGPLRLEWQRRLAVDADVFKASRPLDRDEAAALMAQFARDPQVEYIEVDGVVTIRRGVDVPPVKPLGDG
jgi:serine protease